MADSFRTHEHARQSTWCRHRWAADLRPGSSHVLVPQAFARNLAPQCREAIVQHFAGTRSDPQSEIAWHRDAGNALSSQVACINFLGPLMADPGLLSLVVGAALGCPPPQMLPVAPSGTNSGSPGGLVDFEWTGRADHLGEWPKSGRPVRGAHVTSADAVVRFATEDGPCTVLIEWKYTERYGQPLADNPRGGNHTRRARYGGRLIAPDGPLRADLGVTIDDLFWEPFYQMARQQMLAFRMQRAAEDGAHRVICLHLSPAGNTALHAVTAPALRRFGTDAFEVFRGLLTDPSSFRATTIEAAFAPALAAAAAQPADSPAGRWARYLHDRYGVGTAPAPAP